ncbi:MAG: dienelactone hydrolase family protein [Hyphomicrobiales bacterium]|nr:dienelactone hydrolase family protein [Hyphomicrobiales bacterium]
MNEPVKITQEMIRIYDEYTHLTLDRRGFLDKLTKVAGSTVAAAAILPLIENDYAQAAMIAPDDPSLKIEKITFPGASGDMMGYLAMPADASGKLPAVLVIHENRGLNPHIEDVARRVTAEGFLALGVDFLSPSGGTPADEDVARDMIGKLDAGQTVENSVAAVSFLMSHPSSNGKVGVVGFCWGGSLVNQTAVHSPDVAAAVPYYGGQPAAADVPRIMAKLLLHYAGLDQRINAGIPAFEAALKEAGTDYRIFIYEGANHAFNNDTNAARYNKEAADLAWSRTIAFFKESLAG